MGKGVLVLSGFAISLALICNCGDSGTNAPVEAATTIPIANLKLDSAVFPGWAQPDSGYVTGDTTTAFGTVDGEAAKEILYGMRYFSQQLFENGAHTAKLNVFDFITVQNAKSWFAYSAQTNEGVAWGKYDPHSVVISNSGYYTQVYAQINKYYFEMQFQLVNADSVYVDSCANLFYNQYLTILK